jgi:S-adenosylmethionine decarboxylase
LQKVGEAYHSFAGGGYTAVIALTESHLSIHTWPEHHYITFDIFISSYLKDNTRVTQQVYEEIKDYFDAEVVFEKRIDR